MENKTEEKELSRDMQSFSQMEQLGEEFRDVAQRLEENVQQIYREIPETEDLDGLEKLAGELAELFYEEVGLKRTAYPTFTDVKAMMEALRSRGLWIGVATTDDLKSTRRCLEVLGVEEYISFWGVSGEGLPEKPDGRLVSLAAGHWGIWKDEIAMVGDNPNDMRFARNGGAVAIGVKSGTGTEDMLREQADYLLDSVDDLVDLIDQINTEEKRNGTYSVKACV